MLLTLALLMVPAQPAELPIDTKPATVVVAAANQPTSTLPARTALMPDAPSEALANNEAAPDPTLVTAPRVLSPAYIMNTPVIATPRKKSVAEQHPTAIKYWRGLVIAQSSAAAFDAWTTRRNIETGRFKEQNTWLRPFAGNASLYAVMQVRPVIFDYVGRRMLRSDKKWVRNLWWVPQSAQTAANLWCGARNMSLR